MGKRLYEENDVKSVANAIRSKNGKTDVKYKISEMAAAIALLGAVHLEEDTNRLYVDVEYVETA